jgi:ABC-2 type transport system ATP-binding protein
LIELVSLTKRYGEFVAVDALSLSVPEGRITGLLGPNGAGKTTTLRMIAGILEPDSGEVRIGGLDMAREPLATRSMLGFVPDRPFVYEKLTGGELLRFTAGLHGMSGSVVETRIDELLELWDLVSWKDQLVESYSHGMRQKLILSSALVHAPRVLVIDEPMVGLDPRSARILKDLLREFADRGGTVLVSTHTLELAEVLCDQMAIIDHGQIAVAGTMADLRRAAESSEAGLEQLFLRITRGATDLRIASLLDALG